MPTPPTTSEEAKGRPAWEGGLPGQEGAVRGGPEGSQPAWWDGAAQNFRGASQVWKQRLRCLFQPFGQPGRPVPGATPAERPGSVEPTRSPGGLAAGQHSPCGSGGRKGTWGPEGRGKTHILWAHALCGSSGPGAAAQPPRTQRLCTTSEPRCPPGGGGGEAHTPVLARCRGRALNFQGKGCSVVQSATPVGAVPFSWEGPYSGG